MSEENLILFLDDDPNRAAIAYHRFPVEKRNRTIWTTTVLETIDVLENYSLDEVYLDHDLGGEKNCDSRREDTGMAIVRWLEKYNNREKFTQTVFIIHSWNIGAARVMYNRLIKLGLTVDQIPFGTTKY